MNDPYVDDPLPNRAADSWRTWLMTGARRGPIDRRRVRGAHVGIKRMLAEGMRVGADGGPYTWKEFSDSLVRQSVGEAMSLLGHRDARLVKLAYFAGMSNGEIARHTGLNESMVQRRLRHAIEAISRHVERGRRFGQRVIAGIMVWLAGRSADAVHGAVQGAAVAAAAAIIATHPMPVSPATAGHAGPAAGASSAAPVVPPLPSPTAPAAAPAQAQAQPGSTVSSAVPAAPVQAPAVQLPVSVPSPATVPQVPQVPSVPSVPQVTSTVKKVI